MLIWIANQMSDDCAVVFIRRKPLHISVREDSINGMWMFIQRLILRGFLLKWNCIYKYLNTHPSTCSSPRIYRRFFRKDRETNAWEWRIFTYPVTVSIRPIKFSSSEAMLSTARKTYFYYCRIHSFNCFSASCSISSVKVNVFICCFGKWEILVFLPQ